MLGLYKANVNRGLINGSAFDDKMAFADSLHELQEDGWNPEKGKEYRQSKDFKKLEKQLLNGRKPTRRYRQLRDALCDNEREYRYFMESKPDVFDPNEKVENHSPFGPDVGQAAMLRLTANIAASRMPYGWPAVTNPLNTRWPMRKPIRSGRITMS